MPGTINAMKPRAMAMTVRMCAPRKRQNGAGIPQVGDLHALNVVVRAQREGRQAQADEDRHRDADDSDDGAVGRRRRRDDLTVRPHRRMRSEHAWVCPR